jgi:type II secretory pathway pseudopilin PulG
MKMRISIRKTQRGFTLLEMMVAAAIFMTICGAILSLLNVAQKRYKTESEVLSTFQEARLAIDQMTRDIGNAGYPPHNQFAATAAPPVTVTEYATSPFAWSPSYNPQVNCALGVCTTPNNFDLIIETAIETDTGPCIGWIRYQLDSTTNTLNRGVVCKTASSDPTTAFGAAGVMVPYVTNVMNNASAAEIAALNAVHPGLFPGGNPVPIFTYSCDDPPNAPKLCTTATLNNPLNIRDVGLTLIVQSEALDMQTGQIRAVSLNGRVRRINPNQ